MTTSINFINYNGFAGEFVAENESGIRLSVKATENGQYVVVSECEHMFAPVTLSIDQVDGDAQFFGLYITFSGNQPVMVLDHDRLMSVKDMEEAQIVEREEDEYPF